MKKIVKVPLIILGCIIGVFVILFLALLIVSPGKTKPFLDADGKILKGSVAEIVSVEIGGMKQKMIIRGKNEKNPVVLFLHGGPGSPEFPFTANLRAEMEKNFTIAWWEQRGSGMSYSSDIVPETMTLEQFIDDTAEVTNYLRNRFGQQKIILIGHSWGTDLGMHVIEKYPQFYRAYIGMGQMSNQFDSAKIAYDYLTEHARISGDKNLEKSLAKHPVTDLESFTLEDDIFISDELNKLGLGVTHENSPMLQMIFKVLTTREYKLREKFGFIFGSTFSLKYLWSVGAASDLNKEIPKVEVPVFIIQGKYDYNTSTELAEKYFEKLEAPYKQFYIFENSAHSPFSEEPEKFMSIMMNDVLKFTH